MNTGTPENGEGLPDYVDPDLSFEIDGHPGRNFLIGNPHTFPGRMEAWSEAERRNFSVSFDEMSNVSPAARAWIAGFWSGSEPDPPAFVGGEHAESLEKAWGVAVAQFARSGQLPELTRESKRTARSRSTLQRTP